MSFIINPFIFGSGPTAPDQISGLVRWYKADTYALADGDTIGQAGREWIDQSASAVNATSDPGSRPIYHTNVFGSMPAIAFTSAGAMFLRHTNLALPGAFTFIVIGSSTTPSTVWGAEAPPPGDNSDIAISRLGLNDIQSSDGGATGAISDLFSTAQNSLRMMVWKNDGAGNLSFRESTTSRGTFVGSTPDLKTSLISLGGGGFGNAVHAELLIYNTAVSDANLNSLHANYFKVRYPALP